MAAWEEGEGEEEGHFSGSLFLFEFFFCCVLIAFVIGAFLRSLRAGGEGGTWRHLSAALGTAPITRTPLTAHINRFTVR